MEVGFAVLDWIQEHLRCGFLDAAMPVVSWLDKWGWIFILTGAILACTKKYRKYGILLLICLLAGVLIGNLCLKPLVMRPRPCWINTGIDMLVKVPGDYSFPSGHSLSSAIAATVLLCADKRIGIPAAVLAGLIMFSRLYLYVHFPGDVLGGLIIGVGIGLGGNALMKKILEKK